MWLASWKLFAALMLALGLSGCGEVYFGVRRTDEVLQTQKMNDKPWSCFFVYCGDEKK